VIKKISLIVLFAIFSYGVDATIEVVKKFKNLPIITIEDGSIGENSFHKSEKLYKILIGDFKVSSHFRVHNSNKYMRSDFESDPKFIEYKNSNVDLVLKYQTKLEPNNSLEVVTKLYDINTNELVYQKSYNTTKSEKFPFISHKIAIDVNKYLNAPSIDWMQKFIIFARYVNKKESEILISDYTLTYQKVIIKGGLNIFPKWASDKQEEFYYTSYLEKPTLFKLNIYNGKREKITQSDGMLVCSDVTDNGDKMLLTMAPEGQPDIYLFDVNTKKKTRITKYKGIDVNANFLEDGNKIAFVSDRLGYPNIFAKEIGSSAVEQLVYHGKNNNSCSSYKNYIVYTSRERESEFNGKMFNLYLISTQSDFIRRLTTIGVNQFPKFSKDGESILFIKHYQNESALGIIRINYNKSYLFPLRVGKLQSIDW